MSVQKFVPWSFVLMLAGIIGALVLTRPRAGSSPEPEALWNSKAAQNLSIATKLPDPEDGCLMLPTPSLPIESTPFRRLASEDMFSHSTVAVDASAKAATEH